MHEVRRKMMIQKDSFYENYSRFLSFS